MAPRDQRHASRSRARARTRSGWRIAGWVADVVVVLLAALAFAQVHWDVGHRWLGLEPPDPRTNPAAVQAPAGLDVGVGVPAPAVAGATAPGAVDPGKVRAALAGLVADPKLGKHVALQVMDLSSGEVVFQRGAPGTVPASTTKLLTSAAALQVLGPGTRFSTRVVRSGDQVVLIGGGDPFLLSAPRAGRGQYPVRANVADLAARTARALQAAGTTTVSVAYDASLFTGPAVNPRWPDTYVPENVVPPITALWVDQGRGGDGRYVADPARAAGEAFAAALRKRGIAVAGPPVPRAAPAGATELAVVSSAPVGEIVQQTLAVSDNNAAEVLAHHVGRELLGEASFMGGAKATLETLRGLGVDVTGSRLYDGSGLSRENLLTAGTLLDTLRVAASSEHPKLREVVTGLPVAGFTGSLQKRFDQAPDASRGRVLAKTGTLTGVHGLAGIATDLDGSLMAFVFAADRVGPADALAAQRDLDLMAGALGACRCGRG